MNAGLSKRFDDLRSDIGLGESTRNSTKRPDESIRRVDRALDDLKRTVRTFTWVVAGWVMFITILLAVFGR